MNGNIRKIALGFVCALDFLIIDIILNNLYSILDHNRFNSLLFRKLLKFITQ